MAKVGSPRAELSRSDLGRAIAESLAVVIAFTVWVVVSKESRSIELTLPWQDDPFDILTSFDFVLPPVLVAVIACRSILLASPGPVPLRRGVDLLRACGVAIGVCAITELGYWMAVLFGLHRAEWHAATAWEMGALGVVTGATAATSVRLLRAARRVRKAGPPTPQPDWLEDAIAVALLIADASGPLRGFGRRLVDSFEKAVVPRIRSHPASAALGLAVLLSLPFVVVKWRAEHYPPALLILSFLLPLEVIFAFIAVVGRLVGVTTSARTERSSWPTVLVGASVGGVTIFAFHDSLLKHAGPAEGLALLLGASLAAGLLTVATLVWSRRCWTKRST